MAPPDPEPRPSAKTGVTSGAVLELEPDRSGCLQELDEQVLHVFTLVRDAIAGATETFLSTDRDAARALVARDQLIDALHSKLENAVIDQLVQPGKEDRERLRRLLLILRILPELERSGDLAEHIASHAAQGLAKWLTPRARSLVSQMGAIGFEMWQMAADARQQRLPSR